MGSTVPGGSTNTPDNGPRWQAAATVGLVFLVFFIRGAAPVPDVNETHYLAKARHYWDPAWCAGDFFCNSADAHQAFYWTFGWLSRWLPLPALAWCGRILTWGLLAWAWRRLCAALGLGALATILAAGLFVALNERFQMAGEWIVGGVEAKGFAYVLVLLALEALVRERWARAIVFCGAAAAFHVLVGGWSLVAVAVVWLASAERPPLASLLWPLAAALVLSLPGLLPAVALTWGADPGTVSEAHWFYVYERLYHHLWAESFPTWFIVRHLLLVGVLVVLAWHPPRGAGYQTLCRFVAAAVGLAAIGMALSLLVPFKPALAADLLRYYWFRMSDVMVPLGVAILLTARAWESTRYLRRHAFAVAALVFAVGGDLADTVWQRHVDPRPPADASITNLAAWREMCQWAAENTSPDAVFLVPRLSQTFRWYAGRAEVVSYKDLPQDAAGVVEWRRRMERIYAGAANGERWQSSLAELGARRLQELGREFGADYVLTTADPPLYLERVGPANASYALYRLRRGP